MPSVEVLTPERLVLTSAGDIILLPALTGVLGVRQGHEPLIVPLKAGEVIIKQDKGGEEHLAVAGGFAEILPDMVRIMADSAERAEELNEAEIKEAVARAQKAKAENKDQAQFAELTALLEHNLARLKVSQRKKARGGHSHIEL